MPAAESCNDADKQGLLKLKAPADARANRFEEDHCASECGHREKDTEQIGGAVSSQLRFVVLSKFGG